MLVNPIKTKGLYFQGLERLRLFFLLLLNGDAVKMVMKLKIFCVVLDMKQLL